MLLVSAFLLFGCREENLTFENETIPDNQKVSFRTINLEKSSLIAQKASFSGILQKDSTESFIDYNHVEYLQYGDRETYTFKILNSNPDAPFQNIVVTQYPNGEIKTKIVSYNLTGHEKSQLLKGNGIDYAGKVSSVTTDANALNGKFESNGRCYRETTVYIQCGSGQHNSTNIQDWGQCTHPQKPQTYVKIEEISCTGNGGGTGTIGGPTNPSDPGTLDPLTPTLPVPNNFAFTRLIHQLPTNLQQVINSESNLDFYWGLNNYFYSNTYSQEVKNFISWAVQFKNDNSETTWEQFENWFITKSEDSDGEYIDNLDDILNTIQYQTKQMPTYSQFVNAFPKLDYYGYLDTINKCPHHKSIQ